MTQSKQLRTAVRQVHVEQLHRGLHDLKGYQRALIIFRCRGAVVGQTTLPVREGFISLARIQDCLPAVAWPVWQQFMADETILNGPLPRASVVVCTRDRTADLAHCLPGLARLATQDTEVIIVDNCPADTRTAELVATYPGLRYILEPRPGLNVARNCGLQAASGEVVAFTDDDAQIDPGWLQALLQHFDNPVVGLVTGITMPLELETPAQRWFEETDGFGRGFTRKYYDAGNTNILATGLIGAGVNMAIRRSILPRIGLFDEALDGGTPSRSGGDQEFFYRVLAHGYRIVYEPAALVWHRHRPDWESLRRTIYGYGVGVFAWWTRALLVEKELAVLKLAPRWFLQHHVRNLIRALFRRSGHPPRDLALAEFRGALAGPISYLRSRRRLRLPTERPSSSASIPASPQDQALPQDGRSKPANSLEAQ